MKRQKKLLGLLAVFTILCIVTICVSTIEKQKEEITNTNDVLFELEEDSINKISWNYYNTSYSFHKNDDNTWVYDADETFPIDQDKMQEIIEHFAKVSVEFTISEVTDYSQYGLDKEKLTLTVSTDEESYTIVLGNYSEMDEERYIKIDDNNAYLAEEDYLEIIQTEPDDLIKNDEIPDLAEAVQLSISGDNNLDIIYQEEAGYCYSDEYVYYLKENNKYSPLGQSLVKSVLSKISSITLDDYVSYNADTIDLSVYGLDLPSYTVSLTYPSDENEETFVCYLGQDESENYYFQIKDSKLIYEITSTDFNTIKDLSFETLKPEEVVLLDYDEDVTQMNITLSNANYSFIFDSKKITYQDEEVEFDDVINSLESLIYNDEEYEETNKKSKELSLTIYLNNENYEAVQIDIYQYNGDNCLVYFDSKVQGLVDRELVVNLIEEINKIILN